MLLQTLRTQHADTASISTAVARLTPDRVEKALDATRLGLPTATQVITIRRARLIDQAAVEAELATLLMWAIGRTSVKQVFTNDQMYDFVATIVNDTDYNMLSVEHIAIAIRNGFKGYYGQMYERFDLALLLEWINKYAIERMRTIEEAAYNDHLRTAERSSTPRATFFATKKK